MSTNYDIHDQEMDSINIKDIQDENIDIEQVFEPDDCTNYNESYAVCDYPCDDCVKTLKNSGELDERNI